MALVTEDGTGRANAESFASVADADAYHAARGATAWAALSTGDKEVNLRKATDYMQAEYDTRWSGDRVSSVQALSWPRSGVYRGIYLLSSATVPAEVVRACCELALKASAGPLTTDAGPQVKSEQVGPIAVNYADGARQSTKYTAVEGMLAALFGAGGGSIRLVRA